MPRWDLVSAFNSIARTVDLALTHSNNALSFDNGTHVPPKKLHGKCQKREHASRLHTLFPAALRTRNILLFCINFLVRSIFNIELWHNRNNNDGEHTQKKLIPCRFCCCWIFASEYFLSLLSFV